MGTVHVCGAHSTSPELLVCRTTSQRKKCCLCQVYEKRSGAIGWAAGTCLLHQSSTVAWEESEPGKIRTPLPLGPIFGGGAREGTYHHTPWFPKPLKSASGKGTPWWHKDFPRFRKAEDSGVIPDPLNDLVLAWAWPPPPSAWAALLLWCSRCRRSLVMFTIVKTPLWATHMGMTQAAGVAASDREILAVDSYAQGPPPAHLLSLVSHKDIPLLQALCCSCKGDTRSPPPMYSKLPSPLAQ
jgi:hypothetical protein